MRLVHLSDTHGHIVPVPDAEILIHTGDIGGHTSKRNCQRFHDWMASLPHRYKILVPGNHDRFIADHPDRARALMPSVTLLIDELIEIDGLRIYGTPWTLPYLNLSFMKPEPELARQFARWPDRIDILASHGPAYGFLDDTRDPCLPDSHVGSRALLDAIRRVRPRYALCGHIHEGYGTVSDGQTSYVNSSILDEWLRPSRSPHQFEIHP